MATRIKLVGLVLALASAVGTVQGCAASDSTESGAPAEPSGGAQADAPSQAFSQVSALARADAPLLRFLQRSVGGLLPRDQYFESPGWRGLGASGSRIAVRVGPRANEAFSAGLSDSAGRTLRIVRTGAAPAEMRVHNGQGVYEEAYPSVDILVAATEYRYEELLVLRDSRARTSFSWSVELPEWLPRMELEPGGSLAFVDTEGRPALRIPAPFAVDAAAQRRDASIRVEGDQIVIEVDTTGLEYPILLDPALEVAVWTQKVDGPIGRATHMMAFDESVSYTLMFGGYDVSGGCSGAPFCSDAWTWNGTAWGVAATGPAGRREAAMAYDPNTKQILLFGGFNGGYLSDTWVFNSGVWTQRCLSCVSGTNKPLGARGPAMAYDPGLKQLVLFGGNASGVYSKQMWAWNDASNIWVELCKAPSSCDTNKPVARSGHIMSQDVDGDIIVFGGFNGATLVSDTYMYDSTSNNWSKYTGTPVPASRQQAGAAYDTNRKRVVMFGGKGVSGAINDTMEWDGQKWIAAFPVAVGTVPSVRSTSMAYDSVRREAVVFSGDTPAGPIELSDTHTYYVRGNACSPNGASTACDTGFCTDGVCCEAASCGTCQRCDENGAATASGVCTIVKAADDPDSCTGANTCNESGVCKKKNGQVCTGASECASNFCRDGRCCADNCTTACRSCANASGTCTSVVGGQDDDNCNGVNTCSAAGTCLKKTGQGCSNALECASGFCKDGTCCQNACTTACRSCANASGACNPVASADDPDSCTGNNTCDASANCKKKLGQTCSAASECASGNCVDGTCCADTCATPCRSCANAAGTCTTLVTSQTDNNCSGASSCDASGSCKKNNGQPCSVGSECASASCQDSVCCADGCTTPCRSCANASGTCTTLVTSGPDNNCTGTNTCDGAGACKLANGQACSSAGQCASNNCVDGYCCNTACAGGCDVCASALGASLNGSCTTIAKGLPGTCTGGYLCSGGSPACPTSCASDTDCASSYYCDGGSTCQPKKTNGETCAATKECTSGFCVDGVCCNSGCSSPCVACAAALKQSLTNHGECGPAATGLDPHTDCAQDLPSTCGKTGNCDGAGACALYSAQTACGATVCVGSSVKGKVCDGLGLCVTEANGIPCAPYLCTAGACTSPCGTDTDCVNGNYCEGGVCKPKAANGAGCSTATSCQSGFCADGVCCDSSCTQQCEFCAAAGTEGQCKPFQGTPQSDKGTTRPACAGAGTDCGGLCDGAKVDGCTFPGAAKACGTAQCVNDSLQPASQCDGTGQCAAAAVIDCGEYTCDSASNSCKTSCVTSADCKGGASCNTATGTCSSTGATCADAYNVKSPEGTVSSCNGYKCVAGACQQQCSDKNDCAPGHDCQGGKCVQQDAGAGGAASGGSGGVGPDGGGGSAGAKKFNADDDGGCGCKVAGAKDAPKSWHWALLVFGLAFVRRRRPAWRTGAR